MRPTRVIIHAALACALTIAAILPSAPADQPPPPAAATVTATAGNPDSCGHDDPYPVQQADVRPLAVKPPGQHESGNLADGTLPTAAGAPGLARLTELRPRSHLPGGRADAVDTRPA